MTNDDLNKRIEELSKDFSEGYELNAELVAQEIKELVASQVRSALASATKLVAGHTKISDIPLSELELFWHEDREVRLRRKKTGGLENP